MRTWTIARLQHLSCPVHHIWHMRSGWFSNSTSLRITQVFLQGRQSADLKTLIVHPTQKTKAKIMLRWICPKWSSCSTHDPNSSWSSTLRFLILILCKSLHPWLTSSETYLATGWKRSQSLRFDRSCKYLLGLLIITSDSAPRPFSRSHYAKFDMGCKYS